MLLLLNNCLVRNWQDHLAALPHHGLHADKPQPRHEANLLLQDAPRDGEGDGGAEEVVGVLPEGDRWRGTEAGRPHVEQPEESVLSSRGLPGARRQVGGREVQQPDGSPHQREAAGGRQCARLWLWLFKLLDVVFGSLVLCRFHSVATGGTLINIFNSLLPSSGKFVQYNKWGWLS